MLWIEHLRQDLRVAARNLLKYRVASLVCVLSLAFGIGSTTATLAIRDTLFRNPPPLYQDPDQLSEVFTVTARGFRRNVPSALFEIWTKQPQLNQPWAAARERGRETIRTADRSPTLSVMEVTPALFRVLGVRPALGQTFEDFTGERSTAVVLSDRVWRGLFDARTDVIGQSLWIADRPYTVIGVMPPRFWFLDIEASVWTALDVDALPRDAGLTVVVRRPTGVAPEALRNGLAPGILTYAATLPEAERQLRANAGGIGGTPMVRGMALFFPFLLGGCVLLTWLIACANVAILLMAQWTTREHEISVRAALGASRGRLIRHLLTESALLAGIGGALGILTTYGLRTLIVRNAGPAEMLALFDTAIRPAVLVQSVLLTILTATLTGVAPAFYETSRAQQNPLRSVTSERVRQRWRHALVVAEITGTVALLVVMGAMIDGYRRQISTDLGYSTRSLMVVRVENSDGVRDKEILEFLRSVAPGADVAGGTNAPFGGRSEFHPVTLVGGPPMPVPAEPSQVTPGFFATLGVPLRAGRAFSAGDTTPGTTVAIVNETLASRLSPGQSIVGEKIRFDDRDYDVVGIIRDHLMFSLSVATPAIYTPLGSTGVPAASLRFTIRAPGASRDLLAGVRKDIPRVAPGHVVSSASVVDDIITIGGQETLVGTAPLLPLVIIGMVLTATGIYAVLAFAVSRRSKEFALRIAIGATGADVVRLVTVHSARLMTFGTLFGVTLTFALTRVVRASGGAGSMWDTPSWPAFFVPVLIIFGVGAAATWIPSRRALRSDPAVLLRVD